MLGTSLVLLSTGFSVAAAQSAQSAKKKDCVKGQFVDKFPDLKICHDVSLYYEQDGKLYDKCLRGDPWKPKDQWETTEVTKALLCVDDFHVYDQLAHWYKALPDHGKGRCKKGSEIPDTGLCQLVEDGSLKLYRSNSGVEFKGCRYGQPLVSKDEDGTTVRFVTDSNYTNPETKPDTKIKTNTNTTKLTQRALCSDGEDEYDQLGVWNSKWTGKAMLGGHTDSWDEDKCPEKYSHVTGISDAFVCRQSGSDELIYTDGTPYKGCVKGDPLTGAGKDSDKKVRYFDKELNKFLCLHEKNVVDQLGNFLYPIAEFEYDYLRPIKTEGKNCSSEAEGFTNVTIAGKTLCYDEASKSAVFDLDTGVWFDECVNGTAWMDKSNERRKSGNMRRLCVHEKKVRDQLGNGLVWKELPEQEKKAGRAKCLKEKTGRDVEADRARAQLFRLRDMARHRHTH